MNWTIDDYPDWHDVGKRVEVQLEDGRTVVGKLDADDWYDVPIFEIVADDGATYPFAANRRWRFVDA